VEDGGIMEEEQYKVELDFKLVYETNSVSVGRERNRSV
jgi:hypothetical protein